MTHLLILNAILLCNYPVLFFSVVNESTRTEVSIEKSEADKLAAKIDFGELCNDFECTSSPQVESTARQIVRDILEIREGNRAFACYAVSVRYKYFQRDDSLERDVYQIALFLAVVYFVVQFLKNTL